MSVRQVLKYPDRRLREIAQPVMSFGAAHRQLVRDMHDTMERHEGAGLAAPQIGVLQRIFVISESVLDESDPDIPAAFVNPAIVHREGLEVMDVGCLSFPMPPEDAVRIPFATRVVVRAQDDLGVPVEVDCEGFLAMAIQHELEHLDGRLIIDHVNRAERRRLQKLFR